jgi:hypothetical protein
MKDELEGLWYEQVGAYSRFYSVICLLGVRKSTKAIIKITGVSAEIQTEYLPNSVPEYYSRPVC